nr:MAG TPA: hypothetical protein [Caudoviricetes sp.]
MPYLPKLSLSIIFLSYIHGKFPAPQSIKE